MLTYRLATAFLLNYFLFLRLNALRYFADFLLAMITQMIEITAIATVIIISGTTFWSVVADASDSATAVNVKIIDVASAKSVGRILFFIFFLYLCFLVSIFRKTLAPFTNRIADTLFLIANGRCKHFAGFGVYKADVIIFGARDRQSLFL